MESGKKPINLLLRCKNSRIRVRLKNDYEYTGKVLSCDAYMNILLGEAEEYRGKDPIANYGNIFIRGNNILFIKLDGPNYSQ